MPSRCGYGMLGQVKVQVVQVKCVLLQVQVQVKLHLPQHAIPTS